MYAWRKWTPEMRDEVLARRKLLNRPWHGPPHFTGQQTSQYLITGTCYEHTPILGAAHERMDVFVPLLHQAFEEVHAIIHAWCVLPNHYHVLTTTSDLPALLARLGKLHGSTSFTWNGVDNARGRQCWHRASDRAMRSEAHVWATVNYVHHNPVKHGYVAKWTDWPWSSAHDYLREKGRDEAARIWKAYPLGDYGNGWDD
jgi:putative transposase